MFAVIEHASRRIRVLSTATHPTASWVTRAAKNFVMDLEDAGGRARFMIRDRDRDGKFPNLFDQVLADAGIEVVLSGIQMPRMNPVMERWVQTCRRELLDRTLIWNGPTYSTQCGSSNASTTSIGPIRASRTPADEVLGRGRVGTLPRRRPDLHGLSAPATAAAVREPVNGRDQRFYLLVGVVEGE